MFIRIKKAYRKKALELHPDRNLGNIEDATRLFAEVQSAYEVLSDPQERAWYDSHRDAILRREDGNAAEHYEYNVRVTSAEEILRMLIRLNGKLDYSDQESGFYSTIRTFFEGLANEEERACEWEGLNSVEYPSFGHSSDKYEDLVRSFYIVWGNFSTTKTYSWKDIYRYSEAPDRRVRRMMEKENKRRREDGVREFNDAVRSLVVFVRKRDPRYIPNTQSEADRQKILRDAAAAQAARSRAANQAKLDEQTVPEWATIENVDGLDESTEEEQEETQEHFECVICKKTFKSEKQYEVHEKSKKHVKAVQKLRMTMRMEGEVLGLDDDPTQKHSPMKEEEIVGGFNLQPTPHDVHSVQVENPPEVENTNGMLAGSSARFNNTDALSLDFDNEQQPQLEHKKEFIVENDPTDWDSNDEYASRDKVEERLLGREGAIPESSPIPSTLRSFDDMSQDLASLNIDSDSLNTSQSKLGKAKEKRAKKAARRVTAAQGSSSEVEMSLM